MAANQSITLPTGLNGLEASPKTREEVKNLFFTNGETSVLSIRPGIEGITTGFGRCRGSGLFRNNFTGDEELYMVSGNRLVRVTITNPQARKNITVNDVQVEDLGEIAGEGECILVSGFTKMLVMQIGGTAYVYDHDDGVVEITDEDFIPSVSASYDNGRFVFVPNDGQIFFWSSLDDPGDIKPQDFSDAEIFPDPNKVVYTHKSSIYIGGSRSFQRFTYDGNLQTYRTYRGEESTVGYVGGITGFGETFAFVGNGSDGDFNIYIMDGQPRAISNDYVSELINDEYSLFEVENMIGESFEWKGTTLLVFHFPRHTLVFYGAWAFWQSSITGERPTRWRINYLQSAYGFTWTGDFLTSDIGVLRDSGNEYGNDIEWGIKTYINATPEANFLINRITTRITMGKALGGSVPRIGLSVSKDGRIFPAPRYKTLGTTGRYNKELRWGSPVIKGYDNVGIRFTGYGNVVMNLDGVFFE